MSHNKRLKKSKLSADRQILRWKACVWISADPYATIYLGFGDLKSIQFIWKAIWEGYIYQYSLLETYVYVWWQIFEF